MVMGKDVVVNAFGCVRRCGTQALTRTSILSRKIVVNKPRKIHGDLVDKVKIVNAYAGDCPCARANR